MNLQTQFSIVESLQFQIKQQENNYQTALSKHVEFSKLKKIRNKIAELKKTLSVIVSEAKVECFAEDHEYV